MRQVSGAINGETSPGRANFQPKFELFYEPLKGLQNGKFTECYVKPFSIFWDFHSSSQVMQWEQQAKRRKYGSRLNLNSIFQWAFFVGTYVHPFQIYWEFYCLWENQAEINKCPMGQSCDLEWGDTGQKVTRHYMTFELWTFVLENFPLLWGGGGDSSKILVGMWH